MRVFRSAVIDAPIDAVWSVLRRFDAVAEWNPGVAAAEIEGGGPADRVGCVRRLTLPDGGVFRETLLALDDRRRRFAYDILDSPLPLRNYVAAQAFRPVTMGEATYAVWEARFEAAAEDAAAMAELVGTGIFENGLKGMQRRFGR